MWRAEATARNDVKLWKDFARIEDAADQYRHWDNLGYAVIIVWVENDA